MKGLPAFCAGVVCALVLFGGGAFAATGGKLLLGMSNSASRTTTLTSQHGPALSLRARPGTPPLKVGNGTLVPRLNAARLDGLSAARFARTAGRTGVVVAPGDWEPPVIPLGCSDPGATCSPPSYMYILAVAQCPEHTQVTGGGFGAMPRSGRLVQDRPSPKGWVVEAEVPASDQGSVDASDLRAYVSCYNPRGAVK